MALKYLVDLDLGQNELQNAVLQNLAGPTGGLAGQIVYNTAAGAVFVSNGSEYVRVGLTADGSTIVDNSGTISVGAIPISKVTGLQTALNDKVDDSQVLTNVPANAVFTDTQLSNEQVQDIVGAFVTGGGATSVSYNDAGNTLTISSTNTTYSAGSGLSLSATTFSVDGTVVRTGGTQTIGGNKTFADNVIVEGNLNVLGTTTTIDSEVVLIKDSVITLSSNAAAPAEVATSGIEVNRGAGQEKPSIYWSENAARWMQSYPGIVDSPLLLEGEGTRTDEQIRDVIGAAISGSGATTVTVNDTANTIVISSTDTNTQRSNEEIMDVVGGMVAGNTEAGISVTYDDAANELDFVVHYANTTELVSGTDAFVPIPSSSVIDQISVLCQIKRISGPNFEFVITDWYSDGAMVYAFLPAGADYFVSCSGVRA